MSNNSSATEPQDQEDDEEDKQMAEESKEPKAKKNKKENHDCHNCNIKFQNKKARQRHNKTKEHKEAAQLPKVIE